MLKHFAVDSIVSRLSMESSVGSKEARAILSLNDKTSTFIDLEFVSTSLLQFASPIDSL